MYQYNATRLRLLPLASARHRPDRIRPKIGDLKYQLLVGYQRQKTENVEGNKPLLLYGFFSFQYFVINVCSGSSKNFLLEFCGYMND